MFQEDLVTFDVEYNLDESVTNEFFNFDATEMENTDDNLRINSFHDLLNSPNFTENVSIPAFDIRPLDILLMVLKYSIVHNHSLSAVCDLIKLVNAIVGVQIIPSTVRFLQKIFDNKKKSSISRNLFLL